MGLVEVSQLLVGVGADVNAANNKGTTPLHWSAKAGHVDVSQLLLREGANVHATSNVVGRQEISKPARAKKKDEK